MAGRQTYADIAEPSARASDGELLERFVRCGNEDAFAVLVQRHGAYVLGVCRRVLRQQQDAEDVCQCTFLLLARKAGCITWHGCVRGWLHAAACRLALNVRTTALRRRLKPPIESPYSRSDPLAEIVQQEVRRLLDDELHGLPEKYRAPVVLCYLEGKTNQEAARLLGWPVGSMSRRLARARALLQERLTQRGLALALLLLGLTLACYHLWHGGVPGAPSDEPVAVAQVMSHFADATDGRPGGASMLGRLAESDHPVLDLGQLQALAEQASRAADAIQDHGPPDRRPEWTRHTDDLRQSALALALAIRTHEERDVLTAARRLNASCQGCHAVFRR